MTDMNTSLKDHMARQTAFGRAAFGPNERRLGVQEHIKQEFDEINEQHELGNQRKVAEEWVDVAILAFDGLLRAVREELRLMLPKDQPYNLHPQDRRIIGFNGEPTNDYVAEVAAKSFSGKYLKNELRDWPDWRQHGDEALNHKEGVHD